MHDEYDTCPMDCQQELPPFDEQFSDRKWCAQYDTLTADAGGGDSMEIEYTLAHFGTKLPETGLSLPLATVSPGDACGPITSVMQSSPFHLASLAALVMHTFTPSSCCPCTRRISRSSSLLYPNAHYTFACLLGLRNPFYTAGDLLNLCSRPYIHYI